MKTVFYRLLTLLALPLFAFADGGRHEVGNGGNALVCRAKSGEITSVELLDLAEGRVLHGLEFDRSLTETQAMERAKNRLEKLAPRLIADAIETEDRLVRPVIESFRAEAAPSIIGTRTSDTGLSDEAVEKILANARCSEGSKPTIETTFVWFKNFEALLLENFSAYRGVDRAALRLHEGIYFNHSQETLGLGAPRDSTWVRRVVMLAFSTLELKDVKDLDAALELITKD